jgi:hypothetical protein
MNSYQIDLEKILDWLPEGLAKVKDPSLKSGIMGIFQNILEQESYRFETPPNLIKNWVITISPKSTNYPACLAIWIMMTSAENHHKLLTYHKSKFEQNDLDLSQEVSFDDILNSYVRENLKNFGFQFGWDGPEMSQLFDNLDAFIDRSEIDSLVKMDFHFPEEIIERFIAELGKCVDPDDRVWLKPLFELKGPKQRVRFNLKSNQLSDLYRRLVKNGIIDRDTYSDRKIAQRIADTCKVKDHRKMPGYQYVVPNVSHLSNVLEGKKDKLPKIYDRILLDLLPE